MDPMYKSMSKRVGVMSVIGLAVIAFMKFFISYSNDHFDTSTNPIVIIAVWIVIPLFILIAWLVSKYNKHK